MTAVIAVVNHNTADELERCLASIRASCDLPVVVVDNASTDDSVARIRRLDPRAVVLERPNLGYGAGANEAIRWAVAHCSARVVVLLNADTRVPPGAIDRLVARVAGPGRVAVAGPRLVGTDGVPQPTAHPEPTPLRILAQESGLHRLGSARSRSRAARSPAWLLGAALAIRTTAWDEVGGFDEAYGMYFEEVDLCRRLRDAGWSVELVATSEIVHRGGASTDQVRWPLQRRYYSSAGRYFRLHHGRAAVVGLQTVVAGVMVGRLVRDGARFALRRDREAAEALRAWAWVMADAARGWPDRPWP